jgi:hypothetical protein
LKGSKSSRSLSERGDVRRSYGKVKIIAAFTFSTAGFTGVRVVVDIILNALSDTDVSGMHKN